MPLTYRKIATRAPLLLALSLILMLAACGVVPSRAASPTATPSPAATATATATSADGLQAACAAVVTPGPQKTLVAALPLDLPRLPETLVIASSIQAMDGVRASASGETFGLCTAGAMPDDVRNFYAAQLPAHGWAQSPTFPAVPAGDPNAPCGATSCWQVAVGPGTTRYLALENPLAAGGATLYTLQYLDYHVNS